MDEDWRTMVLVALRTGIRMGELIALRWQDVDLVAGKITVRQNAVKGKIGTPKSGKEREIPLSNETVKALKSYRHLRGTTRVLHERGPDAEVHRTSSSAVARMQEGRASPDPVHACRHTFASHLVMRGVPLKAEQELLGHSTIQMTMRYAHRGDARRG